MKTVSEDSDPEELYVDVDTSDPSNIGHSERSNQGETAEGAGQSAENTLQGTGRPPTTPHEGSPAGASAPTEGRAISADSPSRRTLLKFGVGAGVIGVGLLVWHGGGNGSVTGGSDHVEEFPYLSVTDGRLTIDVDEYMGQAGYGGGRNSIQVMADIEGQEYWTEWLIQPVIDDRIGHEGEAGRLWLRQEIDGTDDTPNAYMLPPLPCSADHRPCEVVPVYFNQAFRQAIDGGPSYFRGIDAEHGSLSPVEIATDIYAAEVPLADLVEYYGGHRTNERWIFVGDLEFDSRHGIHAPADDGIALYGR